MKIITEQQAYEYISQLYESMSIQQIAKYLGIHRVTLSIILHTGNIGDKVLRKISAKCNISAKTPAKKVKSKLLYATQYDKLQQIVKSLIKLDKQEWIEDYTYDLPSLREK